MLRKKLSQFNFRWTRANPLIQQIKLFNFLDYQKLPFRTTNLFLDSAVFHQFEEYLKARESKKDHTIQKRETTDDIQKQMAEFLEEVYPGMKQMPNKLIDLMSSPEPEVALITAAILNPEEDCNDDQSQQGSRKKRSGEQG